MFSVFSFLYIAVPMMFVGIVVSPGLIFAQDSGTMYRGAGRVEIVNITPEEARIKALEQARREAVEQAGLWIIGETIRKIEESNEGFFDAFYQFVKTHTKGLIVEERLVKDAVVPYQANKIFYVVELEAKVVPQIGEPDPNFQVEVNLNQETFRSGDRIFLTIRSSRDAYITVFNLYPPDSLRLVFPNRFWSYHRVVANRKFVIPPPDAGWELEAKLPEGKKELQEAFLVVATRD
ncbi:MAG: DUF4384 domain-containing protein, partial [bacterium]